MRLGLGLGLGLPNLPMAPTASKRISPLSALRLPCIPPISPLYLPLEPVDGAGRVEAHARLGLVGNGVTVITVRVRVEVRVGLR